jgi:hypothetical protein
MTMPEDLQAQLQQVIQSYAQAHRTAEPDRKAPTDPKELQANLEAAYADLNMGNVYAEAHLTPMLRACLETCMFLLGGSKSSQQSAQQDKPVSQRESK